MKTVPPMTQPTEPVSPIKRDGALDDNTSQRLAEVSHTLEGIRHKLDELKAHKRALHEAISEETDISKSGR